MQWTPIQRPPANPALRHRFPLADGCRVGTRALIASLAWLTVLATATAGELVPLRAGPVQMKFDADNVFLRYIRVGPHEVLRGINAPIRDQNWATIAPQVSNLRIADQGDSFQVTFDVACREADIDFRWHGSITGSPDGSIEFTFDGRAHSTFMRNRIGFCILHGPSAAGKPWELQTADGKVVEGSFPTFISPHQPAKNLRAITHTVAPGIRARVKFEGEVFEMEDQRNWTDASFKTYCTPLELPYPVEVPKGTSISQKVRIDFLDKLPAAIATTDRRTVLTLQETLSTLPKLGLMVSSEVRTLSDLQRQRLKELRLDHLRVDLSLSEPSFVERLRQATEQAKALGIALQVGLNLGDRPAFDALLKEVRIRKPPVSFWLVTGGDPEDFRLAQRQLAVLGDSTPIGVTRITNFVDLNRARPADDSIGAIGFAINPQIHAFDNASMVETLPIHADVVQSARQFAGDRPLVIGPVTLAPQFVDGEDPPGGPPAGPLPTYVDPRQVEPFAAVWTLGSLKYLSDAAAHSATYFETIGWTGIMDAERVANRPSEFPSRPGEVYPVYHLLREVGGFQAERVRQIETSDPLSAVGIALQRPGQMRLLVGNLTGESQTVSLRGISGGPLTVKLLGHPSVRATPELSVTLPPYGIATIDRAIDR